MKYRSVIALKWIVLATSFLLFSQQDALICSLQYVATHLFTVSLGSCYLVHRFIHLLLQCFLLPLGGLDTLLGSGFALTVVPPSSVNIVRRSKVWQPFRHVLLLSCIHSGPHLNYLLYTVQACFGLCGSGSNVSLWWDTAPVVSELSCQGGTRSRWLMHFPEWWIVPLSCLMHQ